MQHQHPYQADMARRGERMEFPYPGGPQPPNMTPQQQQHHPTPVQPPMNVPQQPTGPPSQQQTPTQTPAQPPRQRKRPAPGAPPAAAPPPVTNAPPPPSGTPTQAQAPSQAPQPPHAGPQPPQSQHQPAQHQPQQPQPHPQGQQAHQTPPQPQPPVNDVNSAAVAPPPAKKSRTNTPWTPQEELRLKQMRDAGNSWAEIAKTFPTRTEGSVKKHWYKDMHYAEFAEDESQALMSAIKDYENNKWKVIGQKVGKPAKACEQYAKEHFPELFANNKGR
ncbi:hypothetical protein ACO1O0_007704 [Amphichorda felina]